jgi:hypothetical protein
MAGRYSVLSGWHVSIAHSPHSYTPEINGWHPAFLNWQRENSARSALTLNRYSPLIHLYLPSNNSRSHLTFATRVANLVRDMKSFAAPPLLPSHSPSITQTSQRHCALIAEFNMTHPPKHIPPEVREKWLALRQKHQQDTSEFQAQVAKDRAEFESRVERARKGLLARHIDEESDFWSLAGQATKSTVSGTKSNRKQPPHKAKTPATPTSTRPATPGDRPRLFNTPAKASQGPKSSQVPSAATQSRQQFPKRNGAPEVIDLISDDEDGCKPGKKTQATTADVTTATASKQLLVQEIDTQGSSSPDPTSNKPSFAIPGATLELFGGSAMENAVSHAWLAHALAVL